MNLITFCVFFSEEKKVSFSGFLKSFLNCLYFHNSIVKLSVLWPEEEKNEVENLSSHFFIFFFFTLMKGKDE